MISFLGAGLAFFGGMGGGGSGPLSAARDGLPVFFLAGFLFLGFWGLGLGLEADRARGPEGSDHSVPAASTSSSNQSPCLGVMQPSYRFEGPVARGELTSRLTSSVLLPG
jgi:hypothetical protein